MASFTLPFRREWTCMDTACRPQTFRVIGRRTPKVDALDKVTGRAQFGADVALPRMLVGKVLCNGHVVAAVAAISGEIAEAAVDLIEVEYEELPHVIDPVAAMQPDAVLLHDDLYTQTATGKTLTPSNVAEHLEMGRGDVGRGFAAADVVIERTFRTQTVHQGYLEPDSEAAWVREDGNVIVWANTQTIFTQ